MQVAGPEPSQQRPGLLVLFVSFRKRSTKEAFGTQGLKPGTFWGPFGMAKSHAPSLFRGEGKSFAGVGPSVILTRKRGGERNRSRPPFDAHLATLGACSGKALAPLHPRRSARDDTSRVLHFALAGKNVI